MCMNLRVKENIFIKDTILFVCVASFFEVPFLPLVRQTSSYLIIRIFSKTCGAFFTNSEQKMA